MKYLKREAHKVIISKAQHKQNTMQAAKKRRMNKKRGKLAAKLADKSLMQTLQNAMKDLGLNKNK
jgi:hypothetical protein